MISKRIDELESELRAVQSFYSADEEVAADSDMPLVDRIFFSSSKKRKLDLEHELYLAKSERAHELVSLRLIGNRMDGTIRLSSLVKIAEPFNALLEQCAWKFWDKEGKAERIDENFTNLIDLRLAGIAAGSTELLILGNTSPDLTGDSALEEGLKNIFQLLAAGNESFSEHVHSIGIHACRSLSKLMEAIERQNLVAELSWSGPSINYSWYGRPSEVARIRSILDEIGEPVVEEDIVVGVVQVLSVRNRIEIFCPDEDQKLNISYHRSQSDVVSELRLGDRRKFIVDRTVYPFHLSKKKKNAYTLKAVHHID